MHFWRPSRGAARLATESISVLELLDLMQVVYRPMRRCTAPSFLRDTGTPVQEVRCVVLPGCVLVLDHQNNVVDAAQVLHLVLMPDLVPKKSKHVLHRVSE